MPGSSVECACTSGESGAQVCNQEGTELGPCECAVMPERTVGGLDVAVQYDVALAGIDAGHDGTVGTATDIASVTDNRAADENRKEDGNRSYLLFAPPGNECTDEGAVCQTEGPLSLGRCVRGWCVPVGPGCTHPVDCDDANPCTMSTCQAGRCVSAPIDGRACTLEVPKKEPIDGACLLGSCEATAPPSCVSDADCPVSTNACSTVSCSDSGRCTRSHLVNGSPCKTSADGPGRCTFGQCILDQRQALAGRETCKKIRRYGRLFTKCSRGLKYRLPADKLGAESEKLREEISKVVRYDVLAGLVALPDGGYNIVATNLRTRDDVRGLVDPSFVAFTTASFTSSTSWKSRLLQIWLSPYSEGWMIPTKGTRLAQRKGRQASGLGWLGVVDVRAYRTWLERTFVALPRSATSAACPPYAGFPLEERALGGADVPVPPAEQAADVAKPGSQDTAPADVPDRLEDWMGLCRRELYRDATRRSELDHLIGTVTMAAARLGNGCAPELSQLVRDVHHSFENCSLPVQYGCRYVTGYVANVVIDECLIDVAEHAKSAFDKKAADYGEQTTREQCLAAAEASRVAMDSGATEEEILATIGKCGKVLSEMEKEEEDRRNNALGGEKQ